MPTFSTEQREYMVDAKLVPLKFEQNVTLDTVQGLEPPPNARVAIIQALTQNVRWRDDGTVPSGTIGMQLAAGRDMLYTGDLAAIKFIEEAASAELNIAYYF